MVPPTDLDNYELEIFNYTIYLPKVVSSRAFDVIDNLLINYAGNYGSNDFNIDISKFIIDYFNLSIDFYPDSTFNFKRLKAFDHSKPKPPIVDFKSKSNRSQAPWVV